MDKILEELIAKNKKNSSLSLADGDIYVNEMSTLFQANNYTEDLDKYLCDGHTDLSMKALAKYIACADEDNARHIMNCFLRSHRMIDNKTGGSVTRLCNLFKYLVELPSRITWAEEKAFPYIVYYSFRDNGKINMTALKSVRKYFIPLLKEKNITANFRSNVKNMPRGQNTWNDVKRLFMFAVLDKKHPDPVACSLVYRWLESSGLEMSPYTKEYISEYFGGFDKFNNYDRTIISHAESKHTTGLTAKGKILHDENRENTSRKSSSVETIIKVMEIQTKMIDTLSHKMHKLEEKFLDDEELIKDMQKELHIQKEKNNALSEEKKHLDEENEILAQQFESTNDLLQQLQSEYDSSKQFSEAVINNMKKEHEAFLNKLASKLKVDYADFKDVETEQMTVDLGENMRFQLQEVFNILEKNGIKIKS